ncbi:MAG: hypothetical protein LBC70_09980 [Chitinispirillales bacterium]|jgi:anti-anti-sigma regulatory factor|nr:hypothetical protein [Chitinispirillales bacterium]
MPFKKTDMKEALFISYCQESISDLESLKKELLAESSAENRRDTVLEFTGGSAIYSVEIGVIVQFLKKLPDTERKLHLVVSSYVREMLTTMNIHKIPHLIIHNSLEEAQERFPGVDFGAF